MTYVALRRWPKGWRPKDSRTALERFVDGQKDADAATCRRRHRGPRTGRRTETPPMPIIRVTGAAG
jgi:hypothetical protein